MSRRELQYAAGWATVLMALSTLPYFLVWWFTPLDAFFPGTLYNFDDHGVYFAWMRQAADGSLVFRNLFTTEAQGGRYFHVYFLLLGWLARVPGLDLPTAYHLGRILFGIVTLVLVYRLAAEISGDRFTRRCIFWTAALSSGLGWLFWQDRVNQAQAPVDVWQAEALLPTSLYVNALYAASLALMLGFVLCLLLAERRGWRWAVGAGLCGLLLGNIHSYDVIHLAAAWTAYLALRWAVTRRFPGRAVGMAAVAALVTAPSVLYMAWLYLTEPVFKSRADTATLSHGLTSYLVGFGLLLPLAAWGAVLLWKSKEHEPESYQRFLPVAWVVAGIAAAYAPFAFQRKMIMGTHVPLALLAGIAVAHLARMGELRLKVPAFVSAALVVGLLSITTVRWLVRDTRMALEENLTSTLAHPAYWPLSDFQAFEWLHGNTPRDAALLTFPLNGVLAPAYSGRTVWSGHWGETPGFNDSIGVAREFYGGRMSSQERLDFLRRHGIDYVLESPVERSFVRTQRPLSQEPFLRPVYTTPPSQDGGAVIYQVVPPA